MKNLLIILTALILTIPAIAEQGKNQGHKSLEERAASRLDYLNIVLDLTDVQMTEIRSLQADHIQTVSGIKEEFKPVMDKMKEELKDIRLDNKANLGTFEESKEKAREVREKYKSQLEPMRDALKEEKDAFNDVLVTIFNSDQQDKYKQLTEWKEANRPKMKHPHHKRGHMDHPGLHKGQFKGEGHPNGEHPGKGPLERQEPEK